MSTTRERRERRAAQREQWADTRATRAAADLDRAGEMADAIPFGQPILVGHYSEGRDRRYRDRITTTMRRGVDGQRAAEAHASKAGNIRAELATAIYSDDGDALERLETRILELEAERARITAYNAACRKAGECTTAALALLSDHQRGELASVAKVAPYQLRKAGQAPAYWTANLSGRIAADRKRLAQLQHAGELAEQGRPTRTITARRNGTCPECDGPILAGETIGKVGDAWHCATCITGGNRD